MCMASSPNRYPALSVTTLLNASVLSHSGLPVPQTHSSPFLLQSPRSYGPVTDMLPSPLYAFPLVLLGLVNFCMPFRSQVTHLSPRKPYPHVSHIPCSVLLLSYCPLLQNVYQSCHFTSVCEIVLLILTSLTNR